jgi:DsbC/DsbD-like thiol-disulfide interchange protein
MPRRFLAGWVVGCLALAPGCQKPPAGAPEAGNPTRLASKPEPVSVRPAAPVLTEEPTPNNPFVAIAALRPAGGGGGDLVELVIEARTAPGWHIYAVGDSQGGAVPTSLEVKLPRGVEPAGAWQYPQARAGPEGPAGIYEGRLTFRRPLKITESARRGPIEIQCEVTYQACDPFRCRPPETLTLSARGEVLAR